MSPRRPRAGLPRPTDAELEIMRVLWRQGPSSVRQVHTSLGADPDRAPGYTTVLKLMQIMFEKGLLVRDEGRRPQVYSTRVAQRDTQQQMLRHVLERVFGGSHRALVLQALADRNASAAELREVEALLDRIEGEAV